MVLHGENAQGKTNLLEATYVLATLRSFRDHRVSRWLKDDCEHAAITGEVAGQTGHRKLVWAWDGQRKLTLDGAPAELGDWFSCIRAVVVAPEHTVLVRGEPAERRQFLDRAVFTARPAFLDVARDYRRVVQHKSRLLREGNPSDAELDAWDHQLAVLGDKIVERRRELVAELQGPFQRLHGRIAGSDAVKLSMLGCGSRPKGSVRGYLAERLAERRMDERRRGMCLVGPHRDDLKISLEGRSARRFASQGQARTLVLTLKLAELEAARERGQAPMFLLDDVSSELDRGRVGRVVEVLSELSSQVWVTTTDPAHLGPLPANDAVFARVRAGAVERDHPAH